MNNYLDTSNHTLEEIKRACKNVSAARGLGWRFFVSPPVMNTWEITFLDEYAKGCCCVSFFRPPSADQNWYEQEIAKQIEKQLTTV